MSTLDPNHRERVSLALDEIAAAAELIRKDADRCYTAALVEQEIGEARRALGEREANWRK